MHEATRHENNMKSTTYTSLPSFLPTFPHASPTIVNDPTPGIDEGGGSVAVVERLPRSVLLLGLPEVPGPSVSLAQIAGVDMSITATGVSITGMNVPSAKSGVEARSTLVLLLLYEAACLVNAGGG